MTNGGRGVAFLAPFSEERYFLPWRPLRVAPLSLDRFIGWLGLKAVVSELVVVWLPTACLLLAWRRGVRRSPAEKPQSTA